MILKVLNLAGSNFEIPFWRMDTSKSFYQLQWCIPFHFA
jgi:hypothetical protein